ncbi:MAG: peptidylprolyl isomerase [Planctomycetota bacterium]|nr:MAG: peptidylprolyl isomerase [Planctomycetota bacterium]
MSSLSHLCALLLGVTAMSILASCGGVAEELPAEPYPRAVIATNHGDIIVELYPDSAPQSVAIFLGLAEGSRAWQDPHSGDMQQRPYYDNTTFHRVIPDFMIQGGDILGTGGGGPGFTFADEINATGLGLDEQQVFQANGGLHPNVNHMQGELMRQVIRPRLEKQGLGPQSPNQEVRRAIAEISQELAGNYSIKQFYQDLGYRYDSSLTARRPIAGALCLANRGANTNSGQFFINLRETPHLEGKHTVFGQVVEGMSVVQAIAGVATDDRDRPQEPVRITSIRRLEPEQGAE